MAKKLTRSERKQIEAIIMRNKPKDKRRLSAQDSIPFQRMFPDGICRVDNHVYSKTVIFEDVNYQLSTNEDKSAVFDGWCDFLNYFDSSIKFQLSFINSAANRGNMNRLISIPAQDVFTVSVSTIDQSLNLIVNRTRNLL